MNHHLVAAGRRYPIFSLSPSPKDFVYGFGLPPYFFSHNLFAYFCTMVQHAEPS